MMNCPKCNLPVENGAKFCKACGAKLLITQRNCKMCGNVLAENAKFCNICGTPCPVETPEKVEDDRNPTMDEISVPVIDESLLNAKQKSKEEMPTMDSVYLPGQEPVQNQSDFNFEKKNTIAQEPIPIPTAEEVAMASRKVSIPETPVVNDTPYVSGISMGSRNTNSVPGVLPTSGSEAIPQNDPFQQTNSQFRPQNNTIPQGNSFGQNNSFGQTNSFGQNSSFGQSNTSNYGSAYGSGNGYGSGNNTAQQAQSSYITPEGTRAYGSQQNMANNIPNMNNMGMNNVGMNNIPQENNVQKGNSRTLINIILIVLILAVVAVDVFWLFRDKIFGDKANSNTAVVELDEINVDSCDIEIGDINIE